MALQLRKECIIPVQAKAWLEAYTFERCLISDDLTAVISQELRQNTPNVFKACIVINAEDGRACEKLSALPWIIQRRRPTKIWVARADDLREVPRMRFHIDDLGRASIRQDGTDVLDVDSVKRVGPNQATARVQPLRS
jgi:hypothetical protein